MTEQEARRQFDKRVHGLKVRLGRVREVSRLEESLTQAGIRADFVSSCAGSDRYAILGVEVRYLDPETHQGFAPQSYSYQVYLQVGRHNGVADLHELGGLPDNRYNDYVSEIYSEAEGGRPFEAFLTDPAQTLIWGLADYWWGKTTLTADAGRG